MSIVNIKRNFYIVFVAKHIMAFITAFDKFRAETNDPVTAKGINDKIQHYLNECTFDRGLAYDYSSQNDGKIY
jgi:hypothetical protein